MRIMSFEKYGKSNLNLTIREHAFTSPRENYGPVAPSLWEHWSALPVSSLAVTANAGPGGEAGPEERCRDFIENEQ